MALLAVKTKRGPWIAHLNPGIIGLWLKRYHIKSLILALVAMLLSRAELNVLSRLGRGHHEENFCEIILNWDL